MLKEMMISPPNSILFVSDANGGDTPMLERGARFAASPSCLCITCYPEQDGQTKISFSDIKSIQEQNAPAFESILETPSKLVVVSTSEGNMLLQLPIETRRAHLRIWTNHATWPDRVKTGVLELE